jgi:hypothetical protein
MFAASLVLLTALLFVPPIRVTFVRRRVAPFFEPGRRLLGFVGELGRRGFVWIDSELRDSDAAAPAGIDADADRFGPSSGGG